ncbi:MAG: DUF2490 domain-containing protein [Bacteroidia bacterium]|nr:DUF2490 domain-containing protein [Bacteroidia bacterium]
MRIYHLVLLTVISFAGFSQSPKGTTGNWLMFFNQTRLNEHWSIHAEAQYRSYEITPNTEQLLLRGGVNYHISSTAFASIGYANITNYAYDKEQLPGVQVNENRLWQQFIMRNSLGRISFEHRYRIEQRWLNGNQSLYLDRIRYLVRATIPIGKNKIEAKTFFVSFYDEIFIHLNNKPFDRNRLYGAVGYQFNPLVNLQLGYLAQTVNTTTKSYLQAAIFYNLDFRKKAE